VAARIEVVMVKTLEDKLYLYLFMYLPHDYNNYKEMPKKM